MNLPNVCSIEAALAIVKRHGYHVSKPRNRVVVATATMKLNAIGKPYSPQYDPNYRMKYRTPSLGSCNTNLPIGEHHVTPEQWAEKCRLAKVGWELFLAGKQGIVP